MKNNVLEIGDWRLEERIGQDEGCCSEIFLTRKKNDPNYYVTKRISRDNLSEKNSMYVKNEITLMYKLIHPNIVKFLDFRKTRHHFYILMEYCNGGSLTSAIENYYLKYGKYFSEEIIQYLMKQIIDVMKFIHSKNVIHRDIKSANFLLKFDSEEDKNNLNMMKAKVVLIDFGFSCVISKSGLQYSTVGTPFFMDPKLLKKHKEKKLKRLGYTQKADIWSLGILCYELLIGEMVYNATSLKELVEKVENGSYTIPSNISKELILFINGMLQYDSNNRLTAEELSKHPFLVKDFKEFHYLPVSKRDKSIELSSKIDLSIWSIFTAKEDALKQFNLNNDNNDSGNMNTFNGPKLPKEDEGIPGDPKDVKINCMSKEEFENNYPGIKEENLEANKDNK